MDIERVYLNKVAITGQIENSLSAGINSGHFDPEHGLGEIYDFLTDHARKYKGAPSMEVVRERFPTHNFEVATDSLPYLQERFTRHVKRRYAVESLMELGNLLDKPEIDDIDGIFLGEARRLAQLMPTTRVHKFSDIDERISAYERGDHNKRGMKMGIPEFDRLTFGIQPHEFVSVVGWQGLGKSTLTQWILFNIYMQGKTCMMVSLEMEWQALMRKWDTMLTNFNYSSLKSGELSPTEVEKWKMLGETIKKKEADIIVKDDIRSCTVDYIYAEAMRYQPDILAVDYVSLMETSRTSGSQIWEKVTHITQQLKQVARTTGIPILAVAQTNIASADGGAKLDNIAYSRSIGQDSDIVLGLHQDDEMKEDNRMTVRMLKNRDGSTAVADLLWDMERMRFVPWNEVEFFENKRKRMEAVNKETGEIYESS